MNHTCITDEELRFLKGKLLKGLGLLLSQHLDHQVPQYNLSLLCSTMPAQTTQQHFQVFDLITSKKTKQIQFRPRRGVGGACCRCCPRTTPRRCQPATWPCCPRRDPHHGAWPGKCPRTWAP
ncbi:hypothetical protein AAZX31_15G205200 [Glycine max]